ncbi:MAG: site-2 protease family protein [Deltaproteobacteria bacterium]
MTRNHIILFIGTLFTTFVAGYLQGGGVAGGISFSATLVFILGSHEMGHYLYGRKYGVDISPPYFIPAPPIISPIGTFGAFIKIKSQITTKQALFDIGIAGPIAGVAAAIPALIVGMSLSKVVATQGAEAQKGIILGSPLIFSYLSDAIWGPILEGYDLLLHPVAFAGWIGLFITALNLIPAGQLDGGHIIYSLLPRRWYRRISIAIVCALLILGIGTSPIAAGLEMLSIANPFGQSLAFDGWPGWAMWAVLLCVMGIKHPPTLHDELPLGRGRRILGGIALLLFIGCFTPMPIRL